MGAEHFARLSANTQEQLVRHQVSKTYEGRGGKEITSVEHRAGWDATFSAPKSVSLTALVGGDDRVGFAAAPRAVSTVRPPGRPRCLSRGKT